MTARSAAAVRFLRMNFDETAVLVALGHIASVDNSAQLSESDHAVLDALRRANPDLADAHFDEIGLYIESLADDAQRLQGLVSNVKGVLHDMEFVRLENQDGDTVYATYFENTNHPDVDVHLVDASTGQSWDVQLKATDDPAYVQEWIDTHPDGEILVTEEIASAMNLDTSGLANEQLTAQVGDFVDKMLESADSASLVDYFPALSIASIALIVYALWGRYRRGQISLERFKALAVLASGMKVAKIGVLIMLLSIPVISQLTTVVLVGKLILDAREAFLKHRDRHGQVPRQRLVPA